MPPPCESGWLDATPLGLPSAIVLVSRHLSDWANTVVMPGGIRRTSIFVMLPAQDAAFILD